ncbi:MAG: AIR synthase-related protein, partial [Candidatus Kariarchaeaceae archaeon]
NLGKGIRYILDELPEPDPIFKLLQKEGKIDWREMYQDFNMGIGFEIIVNPESLEETFSIIESFGIGARVIGRCELTSGENKIIIKTPKGSFKYS